MFGRNLPNADPMDEDLAPRVFGLEEPQDPYGHHQTNDTYHKGLYPTPQIQYPPGEQARLDNPSLSDPMRNATYEWDDPQDFIPRPSQPSYNGAQAFLPRTYFPDMSTPGTRGAGTASGEGGVAEFRADPPFPQEQPSDAPGVSSASSPTLANGSMHSGVGAYSMDQQLSSELGGDKPNFFAGIGAVYDTINANPTVTYGLGEDHRQPNHQDIPIGQDASLLNQSAQPQQSIHYGSRLRDQNVPSLSKAYESHPEQIDMPQMQQQPGNCMTALNNLDFLSLSQRPAMRTPMNAMSDTASFVNQQNEMLPRPSLPGQSFLHQLHDYTGTHVNHVIGHSAVPARNLDNQPPWTFPSSGSPSTLQDDRCLFADARALPGQGQQLLSGFQWPLTCAGKVPSLSVSPGQDPRNVLSTGSDVDAIYSKDLDVHGSLSESGISKKNHTQLRDHQSGYLEVSQPRKVVGEEGNRHDTKSEPEAPRKLRELTDYERQEKAWKRRNDAVCGDCKKRKVKVRSLF